MLLKFNAPSFLQMQHEGKYESFKQTVTINAWRTFTEPMNEEDIESGREAKQHLTLINLNDEPDVHTYYQEDVWQRLE